MDSAVDRVLLISHPLEFLHVHDLLLLQCLQLLSQAALLVLQDLEFELVDFLLLVDVNAEGVAIWGCFILDFGAVVALYLVYLCHQNILKTRQIPQICLL